jgi:hypothetical protein
VSTSRIRQIVSQELQQRAVDSGAEPAKLQLDRLAPAIQLGAEGIAAGDISAITPYLKALDRLDRYQTVASANQVSDDEARKKLMDKVNRLAEKHQSGLRSSGEGAFAEDRPDSPMSRARPKDRTRILWAHLTLWSRRTGLRQPVGEVEAGADFFTPNGRNPLKRLIPKN